MAKKKKEAPKERSKNPLASLSYNKAIYGLYSGGLDAADVLEQYKKLRDSYLGQIRKINKSEVPFRRSEEIPKTPTPSELARGTFEDIAHAIADINRARKSWGTITERKKQQAASLATLQQRLPWLTDRGLSSFGDFMEWFRENKLNLLLGSQDDRVEEFLEERVKSGRKMPASQRSWGRIFLRWLIENGYEEEAEEIRSQIYPSRR